MTLTQGSVEIDPKETFEFTQTLKALYNEIQKDMSSIQGYNERTKPIAKYLSNEIPTPKSFLDTLTPHLIQSQHIQDDLSIQDLKVQIQTLMHSKESKDWVTASIYQSQLLANLRIQFDCTNREILECLIDLSSIYIQRELYEQAMEHARNVEYQIKMLDLFHDYKDTDWWILLIKMHGYIALGSIHSYKLSDASEHITRAMSCIHQIKDVQKKQEWTIFILSIKAKLALKQNQNEITLDCYAQMESLIHEPNQYVSIILEWIQVLLDSKNPLQDQVNTLFLKAESKLGSVSPSTSTAFELKSLEWAMKQDQLDKAILHALEALEKCQDTNQKNVLSSHLVHLYEKTGQIYKSVHHLKMQIKYYKETYGEESLKYQGLLVKQVHLYNNMSKSDTSKRLFKQILYNKRFRFHIKNSIFADSLVKLLDEFDVHFVKHVMETNLDLKRSIGDRVIKVIK